MSIKNAGSHTHEVSGFDNETRPINTNVMYVIKAKKSGYINKLGQLEDKLNSMSMFTASD